MGNINKQAVITKIEANTVYLNMRSCAACQGCAAKEYCGLSETVDKQFSIETPQATLFHIGEEVDLSIDSNQGLKAVTLSYVIPLFLMISTIIIVTLLGADEFISGISGIIILIPYYFGLFLLKNRLKKAFQFKISKKG